MTDSILRFRGCFLGGLLHGTELPPVIRAARLVYRDGETDHVYLHRRLVDEAAGEDVDFMLHDSLDEAAALALVATERASRGGWGTPLLALPAAGFRFEYERELERDAAGNVTGLAGWGVVRRLSPQGMAIAAHPYDESRAVAREEVDEARCGYCAHEVGHTIDLHREELERTAAERRADALGPVRRPVDRLKPAPLHLAILRALSVDENELYVDQRNEERAMEQAHAAFIARRQAEADAVPRILLP